MDFWILFTIISIAIWSLSLCIKDKIYLRITSHIYAIYLWFISSFRYQIGTDYDTYMKVYEFNNPDGAYLLLKEPTFGFLVWSLNELGFSSQMFFLTYETILIIFLYVGIRWFAKNDRQVMLVLLCYTFFPRAYWNSMNQIRQGVSIAILLFASRYIIEKDFIKYTFWIAVATLFHYSAVLFLPLYLWKYIKLNLVKSLSVFFIIIIARLLELPQKLMDISSYIPMMFDGKYGAYVMDFSEDGSFPGFVVLVFMIYLLSLFVNNNYVDDKVRFLFNMVALSICVILFFPGSMPVARYRDYFLMFFVVFCGIYIDDLMRKFNTYTPYVILIIMAGYFLYSIDHISVLNESVMSGVSGGNINYEFNFDIWK